MVCCVAFGCSNRKGRDLIIKFHRFPRDPARRRQWEVRVRRLSWKASNSSYLCENHFEKKMYESNRQDGLRKLKPNAIPTLFSYTKEPIKTRKLPTKRSLSNHENETQLHVLRKIIKSDHCYAQEEISDSKKETCIISEHNSSASDVIVKNDSLLHISSSSEPLKQLGNNVTQHNHIEIMELEKEIANLTTKLKELKLKVKNENQKKRRILKARRQQTQNLKKIFNSDQLDRLGSRSSRGTEWSSDTVRTALSLRFACGATGYQLLISNGYPLPSIRTLQRRVEGVDFRPGLLEDVFKFMKIKVDSMKAEERDCCLTLDEMSITSGVYYDTGTGTLLGDSTIINSHGSAAGLATHALVFMLSGVTSRWKQTVAYHFSGNSIDGLTLHNLIKQIINRAEVIGLNVIAVTTDMGAANQAMWHLCHKKPSRSQQN